MNKFELFMGVYPGGISCCNKAETESGDYKQIAFITNSGNIQLYVKADYIPGEAMQQIKTAAAAKRNETLQTIENAFKPSKYYDYKHYVFRLFDNLVNCIPYESGNDIINQFFNSSEADQKQLLKDCYLKYM